MNKKLIKTISIVCGCTAICGIGIGGAVFSTGCGSSVGDPDPFVEKDLPTNLYKYRTYEDGSTNITGFSDDFLKNPDQYKDYNTMVIPSHVTGIEENAFFIISSTPKSTIPSYIENLVFKEGENNLNINGTWCFAYAQFKRVVLCSRIKSIADYSFAYFEKCQSIKFKGDLTWLQSTTIDDETFYGWSRNGTIYCQDPIPDPDHPKYLYGAELAKTILLRSSDNFSNWKTINWESSK